MKGGKRFSLKGRFCYLREFYEEIFNPKNSLIAVSLFSRGGKTETVSTAEGYKMLAQPGDIVNARPTAKSIETYSKVDFQERLIDSTPELSALLPNGAGRRLINNTITQKQYPGGTIHFIGLNSGSVIRTVKGEFIVVDEADAVSNEEGDEGDKVEGALGRADEYASPIKIVTSYPLYAGDSHIWRYLERSDFRQWYVGGKCGHEFIMHRNQIDWPKGEPEKAALLCPECGKAHSDQDRIEMILSAESDGLGWRATREFKTICGFQANGMLWPHPHQSAYRNFLHQKAEEIEAIEKDQNPEKRRMVMVNRFDAEPYRPKAAEKPQPSALVARREDYSVLQIPEGVLAICFGADVQNDRIELEFVGFGENDEEWGLGHHILPGRPLGKKLWENIDKLVQVKFTHPILGEMTIDGGCIDSKFRPEKVRAWTVKRRAKKIFAIYGSTQLGKPIISRPKKDKVTIGSRSRLVTLYEIGTHEAKDQIYQNLELEAEGDSYPMGYMHYPKAVEGPSTLQEYGEEYFEQLTVEDPEMKRGNDGEFYRHFTAPAGARNEALDLRVYAKASLLISKPPMKARLAKIERKTVRDGDESGEKLSKSQQNRRNWATGATTLTTGAGSN